MALASMDSRSLESERLVFGTDLSVPVMLNPTSPELSLLLTAAHRHKRQRLVEA